MRITPIYHPSDPKLGLIYEQISTDLQLQRIPKGLAYLGNFPTLLEYIWNGSRESLIRLQPRDVEGMIEDSFKLMTLFLENYEMRTNAADQILLPTIRSITISQLKLAIWSIGVRETIKGFGWVVGRLDSIAEESENESKTTDQSKNFDTKNIFDIYQNVTIEKFKQDSSNGSQITSFDPRDSNLGGFLQSLSFFMGNFVKSKEYLFFRVELERLLQANLSSLPTPIRLSAKHLLDLAATQRNADDFWYLVADHLPSIYTQELIASLVGIMMVGRN